MLRCKEERFIEIVGSGRRAKCSDCDQSDSMANKKKSNEH